jgi:shikimate dehydrogenase
METIVPTRVGLIGWPVNHSRSPAMHNAAFRALGMNWEYLLLPVHPDHVTEAVRGLRGLGFAGANVTVPHKQAVMAALDEVSLEAQAIGAVNTIVVRDGKLEGHNTDALGFLRALREAGFEPRGSRAVVLGAGGASRAVLYALLSAKAEVMLVNRTAATAHSLAAFFGQLFHTEIAVLGTSHKVALQRAIDEANLLVNATSVGMSPNVTEGPLPDGVALHSALTVYDLVYNPLETRLLTQARATGARPCEGIGMLVHQGAAAFTLWTGHPAPIDVMREAAMSGAQAALSSGEISF